MKRTILIGLALIASLAFAASASAATHHKPKPVKCKKGTHRVKRHGTLHCLKNRGITVEIEGPISFETPVVSGPRGPQGDQGSEGPAGSHGPAGEQGAEGPEGAPAPTSSRRYDNITPESRVDNPVSLGYGATSSTEFGSQIALSGEGGAIDPEVEVLFSVWTCETGEWNSGCVTTPGATFDAPLTLNVYAVGSENSAGALLATTTETATLPFRPTSDCPSDATKFLAGDGTCNHGLPTPVTFDVAATLPHKVIVAVEFDPTGPLAALNVALEGPATVGSNPVEGLEGIYWDSTFYGTSGGVFGYEAQSGEWAPGESQIAATVTDQP
jgi:hypothetical protein